ncbi:MAG: LolA family protein [Planctomycetota bacterium]|jgi:outer membrane lipoprotein-sorting protein
MMVNNNEKDKRFSKLLSSIEKGNVLSDKQFLDQLREQSVEEFEAYSAQSDNYPQTEKNSIWRIIMKGTMPKLAIAAVVALIVLLGISQLLGPSTSTGVAFAEVIDNFRRSGYTFTYRVEHQGTTNGSGSAMILEPGLKRMSFDSGHLSGLAIVTDSIKDKMYWVNRNGQIIGDDQIPETGGFDFSMEPVDSLWNLRDGTEQSLGVKELDGIQVEGFRVRERLKKRELDQIIDVWADIETSLPVEVEISVETPSGQESDTMIVFSNFEFDVEIDPSLFGMTESEDTTPAESTALMVYPGKGIGELDFGMDAKQIKRVLGEPDFKMGDNIFQYPGLAIATSQTGQVRNITCGDLGKHNSPHVRLCKYRTAEGIGMGSSESDITTAYGKPSARRADEGGKVRLVYRNLGAGFFLHNNSLHAMSFSWLRKER